MNGDRRFADAARWGVCFALALCIHAAGAAALAAHWTDAADLVANAPVITIELAALPVAPQTRPSELPPGPEQTEAAPAPEPKMEKPAEKVAIEPAPAKAGRAFGNAAAEAGGETERKEARAQAGEPRQRAQHRRTHGRARRGTGAGRRLAQ